MKPSLGTELKQLAFLGELARPLTHECNNFLNNLLLQLLILEKESPGPFRADWGGLRQEAKKLAKMILEWQRYRPSAPQQADRIELNQWLQENVEALGNDSSSVQVAATPASEPLWFEGSADEVKRLCWLLLQHALRVLEAEQGTTSVLAIQPAKVQDKILVRVFQEGSGPWRLSWTEFDEASRDKRDPLSLTALACKSLSERIQGSLSVEKDAQGRATLVVALPG